MKYRKMLVPLDMSEYAECVLDHVKEIAATRAVPEVVLLNVVEPVRPAAQAYLGTEGSKAAESNACDSAESYLDEIKARISLEGSLVSTTVAIGEPADQILKYIDGNGVDLVILSSHGRSGASNWFLGSVVERVLRRSSAPVFLVPSAECRVHAG